MTDTPVTIEMSNSLADLAARINAEHEAAASALKRGCEHAINAGRLLIEAKAQVPHGKWLPWLRDHCQVSERTAQLYMHLGRHAPELEANTQRVADLTLSGAVELLAPRSLTKPDWRDWDSIIEWAEHQLNSPFNDWDFDEDKFDVHWVTTKLMHQAKLPAIASWCFNVTDDSDPYYPTLRLCPSDDLLSAAKALAPIVSGNAETKQTLKFEVTDISAMNRAIDVVRIVAMWMLGGVLNEIDARKRLNDEQYEQTWKETHQRVMARLERNMREAADTTKEEART